MNVRHKLVSAIVVIFALFALQAQAQTALQGNQLAAYQALSAALSDDAVSDKAAVQAARDAGLPDANIAGAMQEDGRSPEQQAAALLPANPSQGQVDTAMSAIVNATNAQGTVTSTVDVAAAQTTIQTILVNSGVSTAAAARLSTTAATQTTTNTSNPGASPALTANVNTLPAAGLGAPVVNQFQSNANTLIPLTTSSGPSITNTAIVTNTPIIPVTTTTSLESPTVIVPQITTLHIF